MLIRAADDGTWLAIGQASHAWLSGQLARAWGADGFPPPTPHEEACLAAEQHDVGMAEWDLAPTLDPRTGRPTTFVDLPRETHLALWSAAPRKLETQSRYAALLVSLHGTSLYTRLTPPESQPPAEAAAIRAYLAEQAALQARLGAGLDPAEVERNRSLVFCWDFLSLALCLGWPPRDSPAVDGVRFRLSEDHRRLAPWPFAAERVAVRAEGRRLAGTFAGERELHAALAAAPWERLEWELAPGP